MVIGCLSDSDIVLPHLMTLSSLKRTDCEICLAVLKLITNSNFVGCSTGSSAGLAPFNILSTYPCAAPPQRQAIRPVGQQAARIHKIFRIRDRRQTIPRRELCDPTTLPNTGD